jgi:hypothetical protein
MFQRELACTAVSAHNVHEAKCTGRIQEGGTGMICFSDLVGYIKKTGQDKDGLGRWCWILLGGNNRHQTIIVTAYNPCKNKIVNSGTTYQQQQRYFITKKGPYLPTCLIPARLHQANQKVARNGGKNNTLYRPQQACH